MNQEEKKLTWARVKQFALHDVWEADLSTLSISGRFNFGIVRIVTLAIKGFKNDELPIRASALTFSTLMSLVPLLAFALAMAKGLGGGDKVRAWLEAQSAQMPEQFQAFVQERLLFVDEANFVALGGTMIIIVLMMVIQLMSSIEASFNHIWGVSVARSFARKVSDYLSVFVVVPMLVLSAGALNLTQQVNAVTDTWGIIAHFTTVIFVFMPLIVTWIAFFFLYQYMPNTRVRIIPAAIGGFVGALLWLGWQKLYIIMQVGVVKYDALFGTFAAIPIFMAWLYVCWIIVLFGSEVAFAMQNYSTYEKERQAHSASTQSRILLAVALVVQAGEAMLSGAGVLNIERFAKQEGVPIRLVNDVVRTLQRAKIMVRVTGQEGCYVLMKDPSALLVKDVMDVVMRSGARPVTVGVSKLDPRVKALIQAADEGVASAMSSKSIKHVIEQSA